MSERYSYLRQLVIFLDEQQKPAFYCIYGYMHDYICGIVPIQIKTAIYIALYSNA